MNRTHLGIHHIQNPEDVRITCYINPGNINPGNPDKEDQPPFVSLNIGPFTLMTTAAKAREIRDAIDRALASERGLKLIASEETANAATPDFIPTAGNIAPLPK